MREIKRYDVILQCDGYLHEAIMEEDTDGDYVLSKDYDSLRAQLAEAQKEIEKRNSKTWCAYCGFEIDIDDEASTKISEHIMNCPKHPIRIYERHSEALEAENAALRAKLKGVEYKDHEFCKDVECGAFDNGRCHARQCCYRTAKHFHRWLEQNGYKIIKAACE